MRFINAIEQARLHIISLWAALFLSFLLNVFLVIAWHSEQSQLRIQIPPEIPQSGITLNKGEVPLATVYSFAFYFWQRLNHWGRDGKKDYRDRIDKISPFLTPKFRLSLMSDYNDLLSKGEVQARIRLMSGVSDQGYSPKMVRYLGHGVWEVVLNMRLTEMMNMNARVIKDAKLTYILRIVQLDTDAKDNPWGLALDGLVKPPYRTETII